MEVNRTNFKKLLPTISHSIKSADFLAIDAEFTGLNIGRDVSVFDLADDYYRTTLDGCSQFMLIQFGLCAFCWDEKREQYRNDAYNFYLFPNGRQGSEKFFVCQSSSLNFLATQGFDFNKVFKEGITYMTKAEESRLRDNLKKRQESYGVKKETITIPEDLEAKIEDICDRVKEFLKSKDDEMEIDRCNTFIMRLLYQELGERFKDEVIVETRSVENKGRIMVVSRVKSGDDIKNHIAQRKEKEWEELEDAVGFTKVARMISESRKLVIGHNMLLDIFHTLNHFFRQLPGSYIDFKEYAHCMFPTLLDTKYMSSLPPFKDKVNSSVLQHLLETLSESPFSLPDVVSEEGRGYSHADEKHHEAGYDAYITGLSFLAMYTHLFPARGTTRVCEDLKPLEPYLNKLFLARTAHQGSSYMNLDGDDPSPSRSHVFHITFPREYQRSHIDQLFSIYGQITVQFLDDTSALVALYRRDLAPRVMKDLAKNTRVILVPYSLYKCMPGATAEDLRDAWLREQSTGKLYITCACLFLIIALLLAYTWEDVSRYLWLTYERLIY